MQPCTTKRWITLRWITRRCTTRSQHTLRKLLHHSPRHALTRYHAPPSPQPRRTTSPLHSHHCARIRCTRQVSTIMSCSIGWRLPTRTAVAARPGNHAHGSVATSTGSGCAAKANGTTGAPNPPRWKRSMAMPFRRGGMCLSARARTSAQENIAAGRLSACKDWRPTSSKPKPRCMWAPAAARRCGWKANTRYC